MTFGSIAPKYYYIILLSNLSTLSEPDESFSRNLSWALNLIFSFLFWQLNQLRSLVLYVCFVDRCMSVCPCSFGHYVVCSSSINRFWLPLCYLQTLHTNLYNLKLEWLLKSGNNSWMATGKMLILLISDITTLKQSSWFSCQNKNENIKFKDNKGAIRICLSKKNRQHNGQKNKDKRTYNDQQNIHIKLKIGGEFRCSGRVDSSCFTML
jgi:hypothetical protein